MACEFYFKTEAIRYLCVKKSLKCNRLLHYCTPIFYSTLQCHKLFNINCQMQLAPACFVTDCRVLSLNVTFQIRFQRHGRRFSADNNLDFLSVSQTKLSCGFRRLGTQHKILYFYGICFVIIVNVHVRYICAQTFEQYNMLHITISWCVFIMTAKHFFSHIIL